jgi:hypothetical protein
MTVHRQGTTNAKRSLLPQLVPLALLEPVVPPAELALPLQAHRDPAPGLPSLNTLEVSKE